MKIFSQRWPSHNQWIPMFAITGLLLTFTMAGCSEVRILKPQDGASFAHGQSITFEGQITRTTETAGADRSDEISWDSSRNGNLGTGQTVTVNTLSSGNHRITASWPRKDDRKTSISITVREDVPGGDTVK